MEGTDRDAMIRSPVRFKLPGCCKVRVHLPEMFMTKSRALEGSWRPSPAAWALLAMLAVCGCGSNPTGPTPSTGSQSSAAPTVASLAVTGATFLAGIGETAQLVATARLSDNTQQVVTPGAEWQSSKPTVAAVTRDGVVTAVAGGLATITATYGGRSGSLAVSVAVVGGGTHMVRVVYLVPQDREFNPVYRDAIRNAMVDLQQWYGSQLGGRSFRWHSLTPDECRLPRPADYYGVDSWTKVYNDVQACAPVSYASATAWVVYADVVHACNAPGRLGAGTLGLTMMGRQDLQGLAGESVIVGDCGENIWRPVGRWIGGLGHELGHAFGLHHPPGCDAGQPSCDGSALMWAGYAAYPNTYLRNDEKPVLLASPFFTGTILSIRQSSLR
jgi:hypothetical protein